MMLRDPIQGRSVHVPWVLIAGGFHRRGGMDKANLALAAYLADRDVPVHLVAHDVDEDLMRHPRVNVHVAPKPMGSVFFGESNLERVGNAVAAEITRRTPGARVVVNGGNCSWTDINWVHCVHRAWPLYDRTAPLWFRAKSRIAKGRARRREALALRAARVVVANSERTRREVVEHFGLHPRLVHIAYPGADPDWTIATPAERAQARAWLNESNSTPLVAFVGSLGHDRNKGFDTLLSAWARLCGRPDWDAKLVVAGEGAAAWRDRVVDCGAAGRIAMLGFTSRVKDLLAAADLLVSPTRYEAYGLNVQEAICRGVPAFVSANAGVAERYRRELRDFLLPDPDDVDDLTERLLNWRRNVAASKERVMPLAQQMRRYTWSDMAARIVEIAEQAREA
jgi:glycosyltransferase involved in cell wall biosynthesis